MSRRELDIPGHVGTQAEIERGALLNSLDRFFGYLEYSLQCAHIFSYGVCDVVEYGLTSGGKSANKLAQFASEAVSLLPAYNANRVVKKESDTNGSANPSLSTSSGSSNVLASSAGRAAGVNWGRYEGGEMKARWASQMRAHGRPQPGQQQQQPQQPQQPGQQAPGQMGYGAGGRPGVYNVPGPGAGQPGMPPSAAPSGAAQTSQSARHPLLISEPDDVEESPPRNWTLYSQHFLFAKDWTTTENPPGGKQRENFYYNKIVPSEEAVLVAAKPLRKAMGIGTRGVGTTKRSGTTNFTIGSSTGPSTGTSSATPAATTPTTLLGSNPSMAQRVKVEATGGTVAAAGHLPPQQQQQQQPQRQGLAQEAGNFMKFKRTSGFSLDNVNTIGMFAFYFFVPQLNTI